MNLDTMIRTNEELKDILKREKEAIINKAVEELDARYMGDNKWYYTSADDRRCEIDEAGMLARGMSHD